MKHFIHLFCLLFIISLSSCDRPVEVAETPSANAREARARLLAKNLWTIEEAYIEGKLYYKRGQTNMKDVDIDLEWVKFHDNGIFEVKPMTDPKSEELWYKLDEAKNRLVIGYDKDFTNFEDWTIKAETVFNTSFEMEMKDGNEDFRLKMVAL
ncbi:MAG: hypothetical protein EAZ91_13630 [Cytophagales bacterium]|nr:MAG: hypothetical protein EAZ91_13630 [Cytophagales bacterium]